MQEYFFELTGTYYRINDFREDRYTLIFLHGLTGCSSAWIEYENYYNDAYNILTYDLRGHGKSKKYRDYSDYNLTHFANDLQLLLDEVGIKKFTLISHSYGTLIALEYLRLYPGKAINAVFLALVYKLKKRQFAGIVLSFTAIYKALSPVLPYREKVGHHVDYRKFRKTGDWYIPRMMADISNTTFRNVMFCLRQAYLYPYNSFWSQVTIPTILIHGESDSVSPILNAENVEGMMKKTKLVRIPNANHILVLNNFSEVTTLIDNFLKENK